MATAQNNIEDSTREFLSRERAALVRRMQSLTQDALNLEFEQDGVPPSGYEREQALTSMLGGRLTEIDSALARINEGTYGVCAECGQDIPPKRMEVYPFASLCVQCQSVADKKGRRRT